MSEAVRTAAGFRIPAEKVSERVALELLRGRQVSHAVVASHHTPQHVQLEARTRLTLVSLSMLQASQRHPTAMSNPSATRTSWFEAKTESCGIYSAKPSASGTPLHLDKVPEDQTADPSRTAPRPTSKSPTMINQIAGPNRMSFATVSALGLFCATACWPMTRRPKASTPKKGRVSPVPIMVMMSPRNMRRSTLLCCR